MKKNTNHIFYLLIFLFTSYNGASQLQAQEANQKTAQDFFCHLVYVDARTREHIITLKELFPDFPWTEPYKHMCNDILDCATVMVDTDVADAVAQSIAAASLLTEHHHIVKQLEQYQQLLTQGNAHLCNWELDQNNQLHTRNFDDSRIILQLGVRALTVEGTEIVNGLLLVNGILKVNGRIILNNVDLTDLIASNSCSSSGGGSCITTIDGNTGSVTGTTVSVEGGNNISTSGSGSTLTVSVAGATLNAVQIGNSSGSLSSVVTGTTGQVLTSNGSLAAPTFQTPTSGTITINGDSSFVMGSSLAFTGTANGGTTYFNGDGSQTMTLYFTDGSQNTCIGQGTPQNGNTGAVGNTCLGYQALNSSNNGAGGNRNTAIGANAFMSLNTDDDNTAIGYNAGAALTDGLRNTFVGSGAGSAITGTPSFVTDNTLIGFNAGSSYTNTEYANICIGSGVTGTAGENSIMRLGLPYNSGAGTGIQNTFITGIIGNSGVTTQVLVDSTGKLGTLTSSKRFKENITPMTNTLSDTILDLEPVSFNYKMDVDKANVYGLIAEDVHQVLPALVAYKDGKPFGVRYHALPVLLLNVLKKLKNTLSASHKKALRLGQELEDLRKISNTTNQHTRKLFCSLVYVDSRTRTCITNLKELLPHASWSEKYTNICGDVLDGATVMMRNDMATVLHESIQAAAQAEHFEIKQRLEQYQHLLNEGKAHICNWELDQNNTLHTRNFDDSRIILQLGVRSLTVEGTEIINGLLSINGILKVNGRIILNDVDLADLIASSSCSSSGGGGGSCISSISGNTGSPISNSTVNIVGGNNITTTGSGTTLIVSVTGTTTNAVQIGNGSNSLTSISLGTAGQVLTSNGPSAAPTFQNQTSNVTINGDTGSVSTLPFLFTAKALGGTAQFVGNGATTMQLNFTDSNQNTCIGTSSAKGSNLSFSTGAGAKALGSFNTTGSFTGIRNTSIGYNSLNLLGKTSTLSNADNTAIGYGSGQSIQGGANNVFIGSLAGSQLTDFASNNTYIGANTVGVNATTVSHNIYIGEGVSPSAAENNTMRIGNSSTLTAVIAGIYGATVGGGDLNVNITTSGANLNKLSVPASSRELKENITSVAHALNDKVLALPPVIFNYKTDAQKMLTWGLIAEEVEETLPELVAYDTQHMPLTIKYQELPVLLINLIKKLHTDIAASAQHIMALTQKIEILKRCTL